MSIYSFTFTLNLCFENERQVHSLTASWIQFCLLTVCLGLLPHVTKHLLQREFFFSNMYPDKGVCVSGPNWDMAIVRKHKARLLAGGLAFLGVWFVALWQGPKYKHCSYFYLKFEEIENTFTCMQHE